MAQQKSYINALQDGVLQRNDAKEARMQSSERNNLLSCRITAVSNRIRNILGSRYRAAAPTKNTNSRNGRQS